MDDFRPVFPGTDHAIEGRVAPFDRPIGFCDHHGALTRFHGGLSKSDPVLFFHPEKRQPDLVGKVDKDLTEMGVQVVGMAGPKDQNSSRQRAWAMNDRNGKNRFHS